MVRKKRGRFTILLQGAMILLTTTVMIASLLLLLSCTTGIAAPEEQTSSDWLVVPVKTPTRLLQHPEKHEIVLTNGLMSRTFRLAPNFATVDYTNLITDAPVIRCVKPEATIELDGKHYSIGGLLGQVENAYLQPEWVDKMTADPDAFQFLDYTVGKTSARFPWKRVRYSADLPWPPPGAALTVRFAPPAALRQTYPGLIVSLHYEMYDGIPLLAKWLTVDNGTDKTINLNAFESEILAYVPAASAVDSGVTLEKPRIEMQSDYAFGGSMTNTTFWLPDPQFLTQINYARDAPAMLVSKPPLGPDLLLAPGAHFESFHTFELLYDSDDRERKSLAHRRMVRTLAPWVTENPILMHVRSADSEAIHKAVDQCAAVGFEMIICTFGSGLNMESEDPAYISKVKADVDYAHSKGIEIGGYSLLSSRDEGPKNNVINPKTGRPDGAIFGTAPCLASQWGEDYFRKVSNFIEKTGMNLLENDGSYPGDVCASMQHKGHRGLGDSQWQQWEAICAFYHAFRARGVYLNVPDTYYYSGSNKCGMGYREDNWSLPRERQVLLGRQNIYDGTWDKTPSMGWMFVPLVEYQGGGAAATLEPLSEHLDAYEAHLAQNFGNGVQACYRGSRLYDTPATEAVVKKWVTFYKQHRAILDSDIIHVRRPDGRDLDCMLHVNSQLKEKGLAMIYNPTDHEIEKPFTLPLYYTGLSESAHIREKDSKPVLYTLDREYKVRVPVKLGPHSVTWLFIE
jgi:hypothetical protein